MASEAAYISSALDYGIPIPRQMDLEGGIYIKHVPVNTITGATTFNFVLENTNHFYDFGEFLVDLELIINKRIVIICLLTPNLPLLTLLDKASLNQLELN
jgi:hypothetical protein